MQLTSSTSRQTNPQGTDAAARAGKADEASSAKAAAKAGDSDKAAAAAPSSTKVTLSDAAKQKSSAAIAGTDASEKPATDAAPAEKPSALKSLTYGALGLDNPAEPPKEKDKAYGFGKVLAAMGTVAGIVLFAMRLL